MNERLKKDSKEVKEYRTHRMLRIHDWTNHSLRRLILPKSHWRFVQNEQVSFWVICLFEDTHQSFRKTAVFLTLSSRNQHLLEWLQTIRPEVKTHCASSEIIMTHFLHIIMHCCERFLVLASPVDAHPSEGVKPSRMDRSRLPLTRRVKTCTHHHLSVLRTFSTAL